MDYLSASVKISLILFLLGAWAISASPATAQDETLTGWFSFIVADYPTESGLASEITYTLTEDSGERYELLIDTELMQPLGGPVTLNRKRVTVMGEWEQLEPDATAQFRVHSIELAASPLTSPHRRTFASDLSPEETSPYLEQNLATALPNTGAVELEPLACSSEDTLVSKEGGQATTIVFDNQTREPQYVYWLDYTGQRVLYDTLQPGGSSTSQTYVGHIWVITDTDGHCLAIYEAIAALPNANSVELEPLACGLEDSLASRGGGQATTIVFNNQTSEVRYVYWLDYAGQRVLYDTLPPGGSSTSQTYAGHVWVITDADGHCLAIYEAIATPGKVTLCCKEPISGSQAWVTILCRFGDATDDTPHPVSFYEGLMGASYPGLEHYWREVSDRNIPDLRGSIVIGWYNLPRSRSYYVYDTDGDGQEDADLNRVTEDCTAVADADVFFPDFYGINMIFNQQLHGANLGGSRFMTLDEEEGFWGVTWLERAGAKDQSIWAHEMGHALGLQHSSGPYGQDDPPFSPTTYDSDWDVMSGGYSLDPHPEYGHLGVHTIAYHKDFLGWIPPDRKYVAPPNTTRTIPPRTAGPTRC